MPQLAQLGLVYQSQWFWLLLVLATIYFVVGRGIVPKVETTVDLRDAQIAADLAEAERLRGEAGATEEAWQAQMNTAQEAARAVTAAAQDKAAKDAEKRIAAADKKLDAKADEAATALDEARRAAAAELERVAAEAAREIVAKLTGAKGEEAAARAAVAGALRRA